jgi:superkiller protein 3
MLAVSQDDITAAKQHLRDAIAADRQFAPAYRRLGLIELDQQNNREAANLLSTAIDLDPSVEETYGDLGLALVRLYRYDEAIPVLLEAIDRTGDRRGEVHYAYGLALDATNDPESAILAYEQAIELDANDPTYFVALGDAYRKTDDDAAARQAYGTALTLIEGDDTIPVYDLARVYFSLGDFYADEGATANAINAYQKAIDLAPDFPLGYVGMADMFVEMGEYRNANDYYKLAIELDPESSMIYTRLGLLLYAQGEAELAINAWRTAIELNPNDGEAYVHLGNALAGRPIRRR